jgi:capsular exopolysaccharide synthesis family protein
MPSNQVGPTNNSLKQLRLVLKVAAKNWLLLLLLPSLSYGYGRFVTHQQLDQHGAQAELLLEEKDEYDKAREVVEGVISRRFQRQGPDIANQVRILKSRDLIARAVGDLDHNITHFIVGRVRALPVGGLSGVEVEAWPEHFSNNALGVDFDLEVLDSERYRLRTELRNGQIYDGEHKFYDVVQTGDFKLSIHRAGDGRGSIEQAIAQGQRFQVRNDEDIILQYRSRLSVSGVGQTSILKLQINDIRPERAIEFLDALSRRYIEYSTATREAINSKTDEFIETQLLQIEANIDSLQDIIDQQREKSEVIDLTRNEQAYFQELVQLETNQEELRVNLRSLGTLEDYLSRGVENTSIPPSTFLSADAVAADKVSQLHDLQLQRTQMLLDVTPTSFQIIRLDSLISTTRFSLYNYIESARQTLREEDQDLTRRIAELEARLFRLPKSERQIIAVERRLTINDKFFGYLLEQRATNLIARAAITSNASIIEASRGIGITGPNKAKTMRDCTLLGLAVAIGLAVLRLLLFERLESVNELREATKLPVSGGVPRYEDISDKEYVLVASKSPRHPTTEAFRGLRTNLQYLLNKDGQNTILISSMHPGEGKTFTATNMAALMAQSGKKTLLIDFDLHKPRVHKALGVPRGTGLSGYLIGQVPWTMAVQPTEIPGLDVITSGPVPPNASELVHNDRTDELIAEARKAYDFVVIDTPPILIITDALVLMRHVDRALLVANVKRANARGVRELEELLEQNSIEHVSMVLNGIVPTRWRYYASKYAYRYLYSYGYGRYGSYTGYGGYGYGGVRYGEDDED